jgi:hypothetical protein
MHTVLVPDTGCPTFVQVLLPMAGLFDVAKELARLNKQRTKLHKVSKARNTFNVQWASRWTCCQVLGTTGCWQLM